MKDTEAIDILGKLPPLSLESYNHVRVWCGNDWLCLEIRDGQPTIRGSRGFLIRPVVSNTIEIVFAERPGS